MATLSENARADIPAHVPSELVFDHDWSDDEPYFENVFETKIYAEHLNRPHVYWVPGIYPGGSGAWVVRRVEDLQKIYLNDAVFSKKGFSSFAKFIGEDWDQVPAERDGAEHTEFRRVLNETWSPRRILELREKVRGRAQDLIAAFKDRGHCDFVKEFAVPFPVSIFLDAIGLPQEKVGQFLIWQRQLFGGSGLEARLTSIREVKAYLMDEINDRRVNPKNDLITEALTYDFYGQPWTDDMLFGYCFNLFLGGLDTVASNLSRHMRHLATRLDHQAELRADPGKLPMAVEELLRAYASVATFRTVTRDTVFCGVQMKAGDKVQMSTTLAGRDPEAWENPNEVRFDRKPRHLTFGGATHRCLGIQLARQELQIAIGEMLAVLPEFRVDPEKPVALWRTAVRELNLVW